MPPNKFQQLLAKKGLPDKAKGQGLFFSRNRVHDFPDLKRIASLPRRRWQDDPELEELRVYITGLFALPRRYDCTEDCVCRGAGVMELKPIQAVALGELHDFHGLIAPIKVGGGKTLLSLLAAEILELNRALLLVPAKLREKTHREFKKLRRHWRTRADLRVMSYELLSRDRGVRELEELLPQLIITDEGHKLKNKKAAVTRRVRRHITGRDPRPIYMDMSGTMLSRSILELHHRMKWALPPDIVPLPLEEASTRTLAQALDEKVPNDKRLAPGALMQFCNEEESAMALKGRRGLLNAARSGWGRRFVETPGVVGTDRAEENLPPIIIEGVPLDLPSMVPHFETLRGQWCTPGGEDFSEPSDLWRHARELACGFYYVWDPPAPRDWKRARKEWHAFVRETLKYSKRFDTEMQVARACKRGELEDDLYWPWAEIRDTFKPNNVPVWMSTVVLEWCADWLKNHKGICWVEHRHFGFELAARTGFPYFANLGIDKKTKAFIEDASGPVIASINANKEGRNLQFKWSKNLIVSCPPNGGVLEQLIGRTHRDGQSADEVSVTIPFGCIEQWEGWAQAIKDAELQQHITRQPQKLLMADRLMDGIESLALAGGPLWVKT